MIYMSQYKLSGGIIAASEAVKWDPARLEWELFRIYQEKEPGTCLCGHYPIKEMCVLHNKLNLNQVIVGNCCVQKFMGISSNRLFSSLKRVQKNIKKPFNSDVVEFAFEKGSINDWERAFYLDTWRKRGISDKQMEKRIKINEKILSELAK